MKRRRSSTSSSGEQSNTKETPSEQHQSKRKKTTSKNDRSASNSQSSLSVRLQNADMLTKYRNKNPHIVIETPKNKSNCTENEISDDDEIWLCEIPNSIDVSKLVGKSVKLGSKKSCPIQMNDDTQLECVSSQFDRQNGDVYANTVSAVFQNDDTKLSAKNLKVLGQMSIHKRIKDDPREIIELNPTVRHECTVFPKSLRVRHPLFGNRFEDKIKLNDRIGQKLSEVQAIGGIRIKQEKANSNNVGAKKQSKRPKSTDKSTDKSISIKTEKNNKTNNGHDDDLARIKQIFRQC